MATEKTPSYGLRRVLAALAAALTGCAIGMAVFGVGYSKMPSYLGSDPLTCANCHVMQDTYDSWSHGPHAKVATCNDCHLPHEGVVEKYLVKLEDGALHGYKFTTGDYPTNIVIRESSRAIVNKACLSCHDVMTMQLRATLTSTAKTIDCTRCHSTTGHD